MTYTSAIPEELARFERIADEWWDPSGKFRPLHRFNPVRLAHLRDTTAAHFGRDASALRPLEGLTVLDVGCGGGLISEPLARMGGQVTGIDASEKNVAVARLHAERMGVPVTYRAATAETLRGEGATFDLVLALEIVEHVADPAPFLEDCAALLKPGGLLFVATLNRTAKSLLLAKIGAEYVLRWLPAGTHDWRKFLRPSEVWAMLEAGGVQPLGVQGVAYHLLSDVWSLSSDVSMNYILHGTRARQS